MGLVGGVGVFLSLKAYTYTLIVYNAAFAGESAVKEVAGVDLYAGLVGEYLEVDTVVGIVEL